MQQGRHAARQLRRLLAGQPTEAFHYADRGTMATIGRGDAVLQLANGWTLTGAAAWLGWLGLHIAMLSGQRNRLATLANLTARYLAWPNRPDLIVGDSGRTPH